MTPLILVALLCISAFFSLSEIALTASRRLKLQALVERGDPRAQQVLALKDHPGVFFTLAQIGVNAVAILAGAIGEARVSEAFRGVLEGWIGAEQAARFGNPLAFVLVTLLFIVVADLLPKRIAMVYPEALALRVIGPIQTCIRVFKPLVWALNWLSDRLLVAFGIPTNPQEQITSEDIAAMFGAGAEAGVVASQEMQLIENVFELGERGITSVMTVRDQIVFFSQSESGESIRSKLIEKPHHQFPICRGDIDSFIGTIDSKDILQTLLETPGGERDTPLLKAINRNVLVIPDTLTLSEALTRFREMHENFAMIVNEYGHVVGLVTLGDIVGTLVGDIRHDDEPQIVMRADGSWLVDGLTSLDDLKRALNVGALPGDDVVETAGGLLIQSLRRIPKKSEAVVLDGFRFEVLDIDNHKIDQLLVTALDASSGDNGQPVTTATPTVRVNQ